MSNEAGFYKCSGDELLYAPTRVTAPKFTLDAARRGMLKLPVDGWDWYETRALAQAANDFSVDEDTELITDLRTAGVDEDNLAKVRTVVAARRLKEVAPDGVLIRVLDSPLKR